MPTYAEACLLAEVRTQIGELMNVQMDFISAEEVLIRYEKLIAINQAKKALKAIAEAKKMLKQGTTPPANQTETLIKEERPKQLDVFACY